MVEGISLDVSFLKKASLRVYFMCLILLSVLLETGVAPVVRSSIPKMARITAAEEYTVYQPVKQTCFGFVYVYLSLNLQEMGPGLQVISHLFFLLHK